MREHDFVKGYNFFGHPVYSPFAALVGDAADPLSRFLETRLDDALLTFGKSFEAIKAEGAAVLGEAAALRLRKSRGWGLERRYILEKLEDTLRERLEALLFSGAVDVPLKQSGPGLADEALSPPGGTDLLQDEAPVVERRRAELRLRSDKIARQVHDVLERVMPDLRSTDRIALLDVGCGDGMVASGLISRLHNVGVELTPVLAEVKDYLSPKVKKGVDTGSIAFVKLPPDYEQLALSQRNSAVASGQAFDIILLLTVLHHAQLPSSVFRACVEVAAPMAVIVVIESCVGIDESNLEVDCVDHSIRSNSLGGTALKAFANLGLDEQLRYAAFIDWFYNRVLQIAKDIYVPCNFGTPAEWSELFGEFAGCEVSKPLHIGFDQPLVPEYHTIHVVRKGAFGAPPSRGLP